MTRLPGPAGMVWATAALLLGVVVMEPLWDPDQWWHLAVGQWIHQNLAVPRADPFAVPADAARSWLAHEWLFEVLLFAVYRVGGERALVLLPPLAAVATAGIALARAGRRGLPAVVGAPVVLTALLPTQEFWTQRPQVITFLLLSWLLFDLQRYADGAGGGGGGGGARRPPWKWVALVAFWANVHGAFVIAALAVGAHLAGALFEAWRGDADARRRAAGFAALLGGVILAGLVNPRGVFLYAHAWMYATNDWFGIAIIDWGAPNFADPRRVAFAVVVGATFVGGVLSRAMRVGDLLLVVGFSVMAFSIQRHIPLALIAAAPLCAVWWARVVERRFGVVLARAAVPVPRVRGVVHVGLLVVLAVVGFAVRWPCSADGCERPGVFPRELVAALAARGESGAGLMNHFDWGGYLLWNRPGMSVYIDGRAPELDLPRLHRYGRVHRVEDGWEEVLAADGIDRVLYPSDSALVRALREAGWSTVVEAEGAVLMARGQ